jgi:hypothetical protein
MGTSNAQIGWSQEAKLLQEITKQLQRAVQVAGNPPITTTTTTTTAPLVLINGNYYSGGCVPCESACISTPVNLYMEQACIDIITIGCHIYLDLERTTNASEGYYDRWDGVGGILYVDANGLVLNIDVCPQP